MTDYRCNQDKSDLSQVFETNDILGVLQAITGKYLFPFSLKFSYSILSTTSSQIID